MRFQFRLSIAALNLILTACARTSPYVDNLGTPLVDPQIAASQMEATLLIYRPFRFGSGLASPLILVDGEPTVLLHNEGYTRIFLKPGVHVITTTYNEQWIRGSLSAVDLEVNAGETHYLRVLAETRFILIMAYATDFSLSFVAKDLAGDELKGLYYLRPECDKFDSVSGAGCAQR